MGYEQILFDIDERVALITLNRPEAMNAWTNVMADELNDAMHRCNDDDEVRAVVLTGAGDRAFCAGADLGRGGSTFGGRERRASDTGRAAEPRPADAPFIRWGRGRSFQHPAYPRWGPPPAPADDFWNIVMKTPEHARASYVAMAVLGCGPAGGSCSTGEAGTLWLWRFCRERRL